MKKIAITMGDPGGIGPEVIVKAISLPETSKICRPFIIGDEVVIKKILDILNLPFAIRLIDSPSDSKFSQSYINLINVGMLKKFERNKPTREGGQACVSYIYKAVELALTKQVDAIVTAPISKESLKLAGFDWPGHTEMLADLTKTKDYTMMLIGGQLKVILTTIHTALRDVPALLTRKKILNTIRLAKKACDLLSIKKPKIAVAGLNPHAGENGLFGDEEKKKITPAIKAALKEGIPVSGPYPPDTIFYKAYRGEIDIVVCMYHDQGLIPLKMIAFDKGVNVTIGLPFIRTSPDHGTAYDIAWKGIANPSSMFEAIRLAARLDI